MLSRAGSEDLVNDTPVDLEVLNTGPGAEGRCEGFEPGSGFGMVCVESANAGPDVIRLEPGQVHVLGTSLSVE